MKSLLAALITFWHWWKGFSLDQKIQSLILAVLLLTLAATMLIDFLKHRKRIKFLEYTNQESNGNSCYIRLWYSNNNIRPIKVRKFIIKTYNGNLIKDYPSFDLNDFLTEGNVDIVGISSRDKISEDGIRSFTLIDSVKKKYVGYVYKDRIFESRIMGLLLYLWYQVSHIDYRPNFSF